MWYCFIDDKSCATVKSTISFNIRSRIEEIVTIISIVMLTELCFLFPQITCTDKLLITDITTGYPGSVHDARVFCNSSLYASLQLLPVQYHVLGDSAYPPDMFILTSLRDNGHLNAVEKHYNYVQ